jgi:hypothetical protein
VTLVAKGLPLTITFLVTFIVASRSKMPPASAIIIAIATTQRPHDDECGFLLSVAILHQSKV